MGESDLGEQRRSSAEQMQAIHVHAIRRHWLSSSIWITIHLPLSGAFILASSTLSDLVLAHDCVNSPVSELAEAYASKSLEELEQPMRW